MRKALPVISLILCTSLLAQQPDRQTHSVADVRDEAERLNQTPFGVVVPEVRRSSPADNSEVISKTRLGHSVPRMAKRQFEQGLQAGKKGRTGESIRHLALAIGLDPLYWEAHAQLADLYWQTGEKAAALECLEAALAIDANSEILQSNKAVALLDLGRPAEAEVAAYRTLRLNPQSVAGHYLLALAMLRQGKIIEETAEHLKSAVGRIPQAQEIYNRLREHLSSP